MVDMVKFKENKSDKKKRVVRISFKKIFLLFLMTFLFFSILGSIMYEISDKVAVIEIKGPIMIDRDVSLYGESVSSRSIAQKLYSIGNDPSYKAVILDINSPGGSPVASEEISKAIDYVKENNITVYTLYNDIGASGAFWVGESANYVYASSMSVVGSVGVTSAGLSFEDFIKRYNITYRRLVAGKYKDIGTPFRNMTKEEREIIQNILDDIHEKFINHIARERNLSYDFVKNFSDGRIFLADRAKQLGLVDEIGYYQDVVNRIKNETNNSEIIFEKYTNDLSFIESITQSLSFYRGFEENYNIVNLR